MAFGKWLGGGLGWALGGPIGAIIGFALGSLLDESEVTVTRGRTTSSSSYASATVNDFTASLLVLSGAVMKSDGAVMKSELEFVRIFFTRQFGEEKARQDMLLLKEILKRTINLKEVCAQIKQFMPIASRLQLIHYLYGLSNSDGSIHPAEISTIEQIAYYMGINSADMNAIKAMYYRDATSDYKILETDEKAADEEIKKAYRKMALKFHPDKVAQEGEEVQRSATEKFKKVQEAYENIKKKRRMN
ncbi:MAG: DnaJ domain-containing protein [Nanoarchaeota archaeon]|nr:DnaJ domain-containing protein [Nanoarchaeota archaeon]